MNRVLLALLMATAMSIGVAHAQETEDDEQGTPPTASPEELQETVTGLGERATLLEAAVDALKAIKITGYVQSEWQHFDQNTSVGGRAFYSDAKKNLFTIRRGRVKIQHRLGTLMSYTLQGDFTERGVVLKDAFATLNLLPDDALTFQVGAFNRPNYEVEFSSSSRESPERAQITRAFYPDERDLGLMFTARHTLFENFDPKLQLGLFNGGGITSEIDPYKDFIARLTFPLPLGGESPVQADLGASFYYGGVPQTGDSIYQWEGETRRLVANPENGTMAGWGNRKNINIEGQIYLDLLPFGGTILKGEFMNGQRPTAAVAAGAATVGTTKDSNGVDVIKITPGAAARPLAIRNQSGFYAYFVQNIGTEFQVVAKYDVFDRNGDLSGKNVKALEDAKVSVLGFGINYFYEAFRITVWYEMPRFAADEVGVIDDIKDNKTTIRFQYKF